MARIALSHSRRFEKPVATSARQAAAAVRQNKGSWLLPIFFVVLSMPVLIYAGTIRLSPYRLLLLVTFIPCVMAWLSGSVGRIRLPDFFIFMTAIWGAIVLFHEHEFGTAMPSAGIFMVETFGSFLFARQYIRNYWAFRQMVRCLAIMVLFLLPFAAYENLTGSPILIRLYGMISDVHAIAPKEPRWGLARAQAVFEHPILFGVICSSAFALTYYVIGRVKPIAGFLVSFLISVTVFTSLSAGALLSIAVQGILIGWDKLTVKITRRWMVLACAVAALYILASSLSNRSPVQIFISYLTFNADQSYMRIHIWNYGIESVMQHPIFGVALNEWPRPEWLPGSIDNFWLNSAVTYGIPGFVFIGGAFLSVCFGLGRLKNVSSEINKCRKGLIMSLLGIGVAICTVHLWNASYVLFVFLLGSGMWMFEYGDVVARDSHNRTAKY